MTEIVETETPRRGPKPSPFLAATKTYEKAHKAADKARRAYEKVQDLAAKVAELEAAKVAAEAEEQAAYEALQEVLANHAPSSVLSED